MTDSNTRVENGILISKFNDGTEKITGRILFEMPPDYSYDQVRTWHANNLMPAISQKTGKLNNLSGGKIMDDYVREAYRTMEHGQNSKKLDTSFTVDLKQQTDGSFDVSIEDTDRPLYYEGTVLVDGKEVLSNLRFIPNQKGQGQWGPEAERHTGVRLRYDHRYVPAAGKPCGRHSRQDYYIVCSCLSVCLRIPRLLHGKLRRRRMCRCCRHRMSISDW